MSTVSVEQALAIANAARDASRWQEAINVYRRIEAALPSSAEIKHNLALCLFGMGDLTKALESAHSALDLKPSLWQSRIIAAKCFQEGGQMPRAYGAYEQVLLMDPSNAQARIGLANLALNTFGNPLLAQTWVKPLAKDKQFAMDAQLTMLMTHLYERPNWNTLASAKKMSQEAMAFSKAHLRLPELSLTPLEDHSALYDSMSTKKSSFLPRV